MDFVSGLDLLGADDIGEAVVVIPTKGSYTDAKTVAGVQSSLVKKGYDCGKSGPKHDGVDGIFGSNTKKAIVKFQKDFDLEETGTITQELVTVLRVTPGALPPGVSLQDQAALQAQIALEAAERAEHANTPSDVQAAAQQAVDAAPPAPPELKQQAQKALAKAKSASSPAQVKAAAEEVKQAAQDIHAEVKPNWWTSPAWPGGYPRWQVGAVSGGVTVGLGALLIAVFKR